MPRAIVWCKGRLLQIKSVGKLESEEKKEAKTRLWKRTN
jgi:hypothetical protein